MKPRALVAVALAVSLAVAGAAYAAGASTEPPPSASATAAKPATVERAEAKKLVKKLRTQAFGVVLVTLGNQALYYWTPEKRRPGTIVCTGACARAWPPLYVPKGKTVPRRLPGFRGTFGTIERPNGRLQLTYRGLPLYTYAHEGPGQVLCNNVDGWFVVRV